ncbi:hypothetical protein ABZX64_28825 [Streptomyces misionensis]|uniref:hypothetical protein n=1 Tax=Streptomyces misionensis TaxID=67331 RepID=UPI0033AE3EE2
MSMAAQRRGALALDQRVGVGGVDLERGQGAQRKAAAASPPVTAGLPEWREIEAILREQAVPNRHRQPTAPLGIQAPQIVHAARQGEQAKIQIPVFGAVGPAEHPSSALGKTQTPAEVRIVDALAATGQLNIARPGLGTGSRLLRTDHAAARTPTAATSPHAGSPE